MANTDSFLSNYGGIVNNALFCINNPGDNKTIADDTELNPIQECQYYNDSSLANILFDQANLFFSLLGLNIQSINAQFDQLHVVV